MFGLRRACHSIAFERSSVRAARGALSCSALAAAISGFDSCGARWDGCEFRHGSTVDVSKSTCACPWAPVPFHG